MFERAILHLDLDAFFASVEQNRNSSLKGRPLIIGGSSQRGVVASCSYEARTYGVRSAMPIKMALRLCPDALVLKGDMDSYSNYSSLITEIIASEVPLFEKASIDEFYIDLSGMDQYIGCWKWAQELRQKIIKESGLPLSAGLSINKLVSKVSTGEAKPNGVRLIATGTEKHFLGPLSIAKLPAIGKATYKKLRFMGIPNIKTLGAVPPKLLQREFGKPGIKLWQKANAIDNSPVVPYQEKKSISTERTFQVDTIDMIQLKACLTRMASSLAFELRQSQKLTSCIAVKIRYSDFNTFQRQKKITYTASDQQLIGYALELFEQLFQRRQLIRLVGVKFSGLVSGKLQMNLFEDTEEDARLLEAMDKIKNRFGAKAITRATTLGE